VDVQHQWAADGVLQREEPDGEPGRSTIRSAHDRPGFLLNAGEWNFPDAPLRGLYARNRVYEGVTGMESFAPWLERLEKTAGERVLDETSREIPPEWYADDYDALMRLLEQLHRRRQRVPDLILEAKRSNRRPFPNWM
jgi:hypothetical protein